MAAISRIGLYLLTNLLIMVVLSVVFAIATNVFGLNAFGYERLMIYSAVFGFGGSLISLFMSKTIAKFSTRAQIINSPRNETEAWLVSTVREHAQRAGVGMPDVAIYESPDANAFATGWSRNNSLVAVSSGILRTMDRREVEAVLGHEISHIANGDMVTLTLIQGVMNTFVLFLSRVIGGLVDAALTRDSERRGPGIAQPIVTLVMQLLLGVLASLVVAWFSRRREFRADAGGANLAGRDAMIGALRRLGTLHDVPADLPRSFKAFGIRDGGMMRLFATHPPLAERISALESASSSNSRVASMRGGSYAT